jgi:hypothetical protein
LRSVQPQPNVSTNPDAPHVEASLLVRRLSEEARDAFDLDVLRPATYEALATALREASERDPTSHRGLVRKSAAPSPCFW